MEENEEVDEIYEGVYATMGNDGEMAYCFITQKLLLTRKKKHKLHKRIHYLGHVELSIEKCVKLLLTMDLLKKLCLRN